jgi:hypothetical protein
VPPLSKALKESSLLAVNVIELVVRTPMNAVGAEPVVIMAPGPLKKPPSISAPLRLSVLPLATLSVELLFR